MTDMELQEELEVGVHEYGVSRNSQMDGHGYGVARSSDVGVHGCSVNGNSQMGWTRIWSCKDLGSRCADLEWEASQKWACMDMAPTGTPKWEDIDMELQGARKWVCISMVSTGTSKLIDTDMEF